MFVCRSTNTRRSKTGQHGRVPPGQHVEHGRGARRGMAVLLVLGLLAITLAVSYATLRGQGMTAQLARNNSRALDARETARSGVAAALRKISEDGWAGVGVPLSTNITGNTWYEVTFTTGDARLTAADPQYGEYPFRITIDSIGYASDPNNPTVRASYKSRCIVQLVRRALVAEPANWSMLTNFTVYQWGNRPVTVQIPVRVSGTANILGPTTLCPEYPLTTASRDQYLSDLNAMRLAGKPDYRPFNSPLTIALSRQSATTVNLLTTKLGLTTVDTTASTSTPLTHPGAVLTYKLYPGGQDYTIPVLQTLYGSALADLTLGPNPITNPLGVFRSTGTLSLQNNVRITGTVIAETTASDIQVTGTNVVLQANNLPALSGSSQTYQLPAALIRDDLRMSSASDAQINGFAMVWDEFELKQGGQGTKFALQGNLVTSMLTLRGRSNWVLTATEWGQQLTTFQTNLLLSLTDPSRVPFFPEWMEQKKGLTVKPALTFQPDSSGVMPHWQNWTQPIYKKAASDSGLMWEVIRWEDGT